MNFNKPPVASGWGKDVMSGPETIWALWFLNVWNQLDKNTARIYRSAAYSTPGTGFVKVPLETTSYNTTVNEQTSMVDLTNNRIRPNKEGYYTVIGRTSVTSAAADNRVLVTIYKNGVIYSRGTGSVSATATSIGLGGPVHDIIYMNGQTDYLEMYVYTSSALALEVGSESTFFTVSGPI